MSRGPCSGSGRTRLVTYGLSLGPEILIVLIILFSCAESKRKTPCGPNEDTSGGQDALSDSVSLRPRHKDLRLMDYDLGGWFRRSSKYDQQT